MCKKKITGGKKALNLPIFKLDVRLRLGNNEFEYREVRTTFSLCYFFYKTIFTKKMGFSASLGIILHTF